jgi:hypothetical protein
MDDPITFESLMLELEQVYGDIETEQMARVNFENAEQKPDESLQLWADRVKLLGRKALTGTSNRVELARVIEQFCMGLNVADKRIGRSVYINDRPNTLTEAISMVQRRLSIEMLYPGQGQGGKSQKARVGKIVESGPGEEYNSRVVKTTKSDQPSSKPPQNISSVGFSMEDFLKFIQNLQVKDSTGQNKFSGPRRGVCYRCGDKNHFVKDCPHKKPLNDQGTGKEAESQSKEN